MARDWEPGMRKSKPQEKGQTSGSGKWSKYRNSKPSGSMDWADCDATLLCATVSAIVLDGDAVLLGGTRDGGTLVLTLISGDDRLKFYAKSAEEMNGHLQEIRDFKP